MILTGSMSDPYMHCEETLKLTRQCLESILKAGFGVSVLTKSDQILRDMDLYEELNRKTKCVVMMTLTTYDEALSGIAEPNVCGTGRRLEVLQKMQRRGIPTMVWLNPNLPYIKDTEENISSLLCVCANAGVKGIVCFGMGTTLRECYEKMYGLAYEIPGRNADGLMRTFHEFCEAHHILHETEDCFRCMREMPRNYEQMSLF